MPEGGSSRSIKKEDDSSQSSTCMVDTTTRGCPEEAAAWRGQRPALREWGGQCGRLGAAAAIASWSARDPQGSLKDRGRLGDPPSASRVQSVTQQPASPASGQGLDLHCYSSLWSQAAIHILTELNFGNVVPQLYQPHSGFSAATRARGCLVTQCRFRALRLCRKFPQEGAGWLGQGLQVRTGCCVSRVQILAPLPAAGGCDVRPWVCVEYRFPPGSVGTVPERDGPACGESSWKDHFELTGSRRCHPVRQGLGVGPSSIEALARAQA